MRIASERWRSRIKTILFGVLVLTASTGAANEPELQNGLTLRGDLIPLIERLAPRVDLFKAIWEQDPEAIIYAGANRDFFYYILGHFKDARDRRDIDLIKESLARRDFQVREFMMAESDIDVATNVPLGLDAGVYNLAKIDTIPPARLDVNTPMGRTEVDQGYLPVEKIALGKNGFIALPQFKDGLGELFTGEFTMQMTPPEIYNETYWVKLRVNHPILLVLRHLRVLAMDEYYRYGRGVPKRTIDQLITAEDQRVIKRIVEVCLNGRELEPYLKTGNFAKWFNGTIRKAFRAHGNPTLANQLMHHFQINKLAQRYSAIKFINNFVFAKYHDPAVIARHRQEFNVDPKKFMIPAEKAMPGLKVYHGTGEEWIFNAIITESAIFSTGGSFGQGFYCVGEPHKDFARRWHGSGDNVILATISKDALIVDVTSGEGARVYDEFRASVHAKPAREQVDASARGYVDVFDLFADYFGLDAIHNGHEFAIKNSLVIEKYTGAFKRVLTYPQAIELAPEIDSAKEFRRFIHDLGLSRLSYSEMKTILARVPYDLYVDVIEREKLLDGVDARSAVTMFEMTRDKIHLPRLYQVARRAMSRKDFRALIEGTVPLLNAQASDVSTSVIEGLSSVDEIAPILNVILRRIDQPANFLIFGNFVNGHAAQRAAAFRALRGSHFADEPIPWTDEQVRDSPLDHLEDWSRPEQYWVALSWLKAGFRQAQALAALEIAFDRLAFEWHADRVQASYDGTAFFGGPLTREEDGLEFQQTLRDGARVLLRRTQSAQTFARLLRLVPNLNYNGDEQIELLRRLDVAPRIADVPAPEARQIAIAYMRAVVDSADFEPLRPALEAVIALHPEVLPEFFLDVKFRNWVPLAHLTANPVRDVDYLVQNLEVGPSLRRALTAFLLALNDVDVTQNTGRVATELARAKFDRDKFVTNGGQTLAHEELIWLLENVVARVRAAPGDHLDLAAKLVELPALHPALELTEFGSRYEILRVNALVPGGVEGDGDAVAGLSQVILDPRRSRNFKLAAGRALRRLGPRHPAVTELERKLKWAFVASRRRWLWFSRPNQPVDFFRDAQGVYAHLFRQWRSRDEEYIGYLRDVAEGRGGGELVPAHLAETLVDLQLDDPSFLPFFTRVLAKTGVKNMPLFFRAMITLFPRRPREIADALYVVHPVPELFGAYLSDLLDLIEREPGVLTDLRELRKAGRLAVKRQVTIEGLWLDDWLARELKKRPARCEQSLVAAS